MTDKSVMESSWQKLVLLASPEQRLWPEKSIFGWRSRESGYQDDFWMGKVDYPRTTLLGPKQDFEHILDKLGMGMALLPNHHPSPSWGERVGTGWAEGLTQTPAAVLLITITLINVGKNMVKRDLKTTRPEFKSIFFVWTAIGSEMVTCIKSWWWDKLFLMWVHACEQSRLVHYVKARMNLTIYFLYFAFQDKQQKHGKIVTNDSLKLPRWDQASSYS